MQHSQMVYGDDNGDHADEEADYDDPMAFNASYGRKG